MEKDSFKIPNVEKRGSGYRITIFCGYDTTGNQIKHRMSYTPPEGLTQRQLENDLHKKKTEFENKVRTGQFIDNTISFADFAERWCNDYGKTQLAPKTYARYLALLKRINPIIGHIRLKSLQPNHLIDLYNKLGFEQNMRGVSFLATKEFFERVAKKKLTRISISESCGLSVNTVYQAFRNKAVTMESAKKISEAVGLSFNKAFKPATEFKGLSNKTIKHHHRLISAILNQAVYWQLIILNPANRVKPPKVPRTEAKYLEEDETLKLLSLLENEPMQEKTMIKLIVLTGMRRGELCGLEWKDINFQTNMLSIVRSSQYLPGTGIYTKEPKTESSKRAIKLSVSAIEMLKDFKKWQLEQGLKMGDQWHDTDRIFTKANGQPIHPDTITGWFRSFVKRNNLPNICVHSLRHTCITLLISAGIPIPTVSKRAGHANPGITTMIYSHAIKSLDERAAEALDEIVMRI